MKEASGINAEYMGTHPIFESDFDCLTDLISA